MFLGDMKPPIFFEIIAEIDRPQLEHRLGHRPGPAPARPFHPVLHQALACPLDHAGRDWPALAAVLVIAHGAPIPGEVARSRFDHLALLASELPFRNTHAHPLHHLTDLAMQQPPRPLLHPGQGVGTAFLVKGIHGAPQLGQDGLEVQH